MDIRPLVLLAAGFPASPVSAQVYRWVDEKGRVTYSNAAPPPGVKATVVDRDAGAGAPRRTPRSATRCAARASASSSASRSARSWSPGSLPTRGGRAAAAARSRLPQLHLALPRHERGRAARRRRRAGLSASDACADKRYTYLPTPANPFITTISVIGGRVNAIERVRKF